MKHCLKFSLSILFIMSFVFAKSNNFSNNQHITTSTINQGSESVEVFNAQPRLRQENDSREEFDLIVEDFEGEHGWSTQGGSGWEVSTGDYNSATTSLNSPNSDDTFDSFNTIFSPTYTLPALGDGETMHFGFYLNVDMPDYSQDDDPDTPDDESGYLADYFQVALMDPTQIAWHTTDTNATDGSNWWAADPEVGGYLNNWVQHLDIPSFTASSSTVVSADMLWSIEGAAGAAGAVPEWPTLDGWDQANVQVSVDGGDFMTVDCDDPYDFQCGYGAAWNGYGCMAGWAGEADWHNVSCDLSAYAGSDVVVRFAFLSDPCYATFDDCSGSNYPETGYQIDNILVSDDSGTLYSNDGTDDGSLTATAEVWVDQFYDYNSGCYSMSTGQDIDADTPEDCIAQGGEYRPGSYGWEEYLPGYPFNDGANVFLDISEYASNPILFKISSRYDDNHNGGQGTGLWIDDFRIYKISGGNYATPTGLMAESGDMEAHLSWNDMNEAGTSDIAYHNGNFPAENAISMTSGTGWVGERFDVFGSVDVHTVTVHSVNASDVNATIGSFGPFGTLYNNEPTHTMEVVLSPGDNTFEVDWTFTNSFILAHQISETVAAGLDTTPESSNSMVLTGSNWENWGEYIDFDGSTLFDGEWGISANMTYSGAGVTYNVYRDGSSAPVATGLTDAMHTDTGLSNNIEYYYQVSAVYDDGNESDFSSVVYVTPFAQTVHEEASHDGTAEGSFNAGSGNYTAVKFNACAEGEQLYRFKWYQTEDAGAFYIKMYEDVDGFPGEEIFSRVVAGGLMTGWNESDLLDEDLVVSGDFWLGMKEFSSTRPIGLDTSSSGSSMTRVGASGEWTEVGGELMISALLDGVNCPEEPECSPGDVDGSGTVDVLDVVRVVSFVLLTSEPSDDEGCAADFNGDGEINVLDVVQMVSLILG